MIIATGEAWWASIFLLGIGWMAGFVCGSMKKRVSVWRNWEYKAKHDALTGLYNRNFFIEWQQASGEDDFPLGVVMADIDGLKQVNDSQGHRVGDKVIVAAAGILRTCLRQEDIVIRLGGDEFLLLLPKASPAVVDHICTRIRSRLVVRNAGTEEAPLGLSLGGVVAVAKADLAMAINEADKAMYLEKN